MNSPQVERSLELLAELLEAGPLTAPELDGEVRYRWSTGAWPCDRHTRPLTVPRHGQPVGQGYGRLYEHLEALQAAGRVWAFSYPGDAAGPLWSLAKTPEAA